MYWHYRIAHDNNYYTSKKVYFNEINFSGSTHIVKISPGYAKQQSSQTSTALPAHYAMSAHPNPFNPATTIIYSIGSYENVALKIFNTGGALVFSKDIGRREAGQRHSFTWDAIDNLGTKVSSGVYIVQIRSGLKTMTQRVTLLK